MTKFGELTNAFWRFDQNLATWTLASWFFGELVFWRLGIWRVGFFGEWTITHIIIFTSVHEKLNARKILVFAKYMFYLINYIQTIPDMIFQYIVHEGHPTSYIFKKL